MHKNLLPDGWKTPKGYSLGFLATGQQLITTGGMIGWDENEQFQSLDLVGQLEQTLKNIVAVLNEAGAKPEHIVRLTWYITDKKEYHDNLRGIGEAYRKVIGRHFPPMAVVQVAALMEDDAKVEIEATAVI